MKMTGIGVLVGLSNVSLSVHFLIIMLLKAKTDHPLGIRVVLSHLMSRQEALYVKKYLPAGGPSLVVLTFIPSNHQSTKEVPP